MVASVKDPPTHPRTTGLVCQGLIQSGVTRKWTANAKVAEKWGHSDKRLVVLQLPTQ